MLTAWLRNYATKRTIPYVVKNKWHLPFAAAAKPSIEENKPPNEADSWGSSSQGHINVPKEWRRIKTLPQWKRQMFALKEKFSQGWDPKRKLSRDEMDRLREIKAGEPSISLNELSERFRISPEAVRRIVKSRWRPNKEESAKVQQRWLRRGERLGSWSSSMGQSSSTSKSNGSRYAVERKKPKSQLKLHDPGQDIF